MAGERTKDLEKISISINPASGSRRSLTSLTDWDSGEGPELITKRTPDLKGNTYMTKRADKSGSPSFSVKVGSQDERYLDNLANDSISFDLVVIDESSKLNGKQFTGTECYISKRPASPFSEGDDRKYEILASSFKQKNI